RPGPERFRRKAPPARDLCHGDFRPAADGFPVARANSDSLLAHHSLERALTVASVQPEPLLVVVVGPTASGKTALSLALAERFNGEIVNCDSVAMYREFDLG